MTTTYEMIKAEEKYEHSYRNYEGFSFYSLPNKSHDTDAFISYKGITFADHVGDQYLTGNQLFYYPELTQKLRALTEYPFLKRTYDVNTSLRGMAFVEYFFQHVQACYVRFQNELRAASEVANQLIATYGAVRKMPLVDKLDNPLERNQLSINGVSWELDRHWDRDASLLKKIDLYQVFNIACLDYRHISLEDAIPGTPFIALRLFATSSHKGTVRWFNLDTRQQISKSAIRLK